MVRGSVSYRTRGSLDTGRARVLVADPDGEEFEEVLTRLVAGSGDKSRHGEGRGEQGGENFSEFRSRWLQHHRLHEANTPTLRFIKAQEHRSTAMDHSIFSDPHVFYVVCPLVAVALLRYAFRRPRPRKPATKRFAEIQAKARSYGNKARIEAEADADKLFDAQEKEEGKLC